MKAGSGARPTVVYNTISIHQAGVAITNDAQALQKDIDNAWTTYSGETGMVPAMCIRNDFDTFYNQQKPLTSKATDNRIKIGQTLAKSATLVDFQEAVTAKSFGGPNIYQENAPKDNPNNIEAGSLRQPGKAS